MVQCEKTPIYGSGTNPSLGVLSLIRCIIRIVSRRPHLSCMKWYVHLLHLDCDLLDYILSATCSNINSYLSLSCRFGFAGVPAPSCVGRTVPHPVVPEIHEMVAAQICLGLSHFIDLPNTEIPRAEGGSSKRPKRLATSDSAESAHEGDLPQPHAEEATNQGSMFGGPSQPWVVDPQP